MNFAKSRSACALILAVAAFHSPCRGQARPDSPFATGEKVGQVGTNRYYTPANQVLTPAGIQVELPELRPQAIALSPNGRLLVTAGKTHELVVIDPAIKGPTVFAIRAAMWAAWRIRRSSALDGIKISADGLMSDLHGSSDYRANLIKVMAQRAVTAAGHCTCSGAVKASFHRRSAARRLARWITVTSMVIGSVAVHGPAVVGASTSGRDSRRGSGADGRGGSRARSGAASTAGTGGR